MDLTNPKAFIEYPLCELVPLDPVMTKMDKVSFPPEFSPEWKSYFNSRLRVYNGSDRHLILSWFVCLFFWWGCGWNPGPHTHQASLSQELHPHAHHH
jgi:hypothetical protein